MSVLSKNQWEEIIWGQMEANRHAEAKSRTVIPEPRDRIEAFELNKKCRTTMGFARTFWPLIEPDRPLVEGWHLECIGEHLDDVSDPRGTTKNLIINIPPRCAKSLLVCVFWFCKTWITRPGSRWMYASFGGDLVQRDSQRCREIIQHPLYRRLCDLRIKTTQDTQLRYTNQYQGFRYAVTVGGQGMGEGADFLVVDDPQNPKRAFSVIERENTIRWYRSTFSRRANDERTVRKVIIMQRLNERDLTGWMMAEQTGWDQLVIPMRYEPRRYWFGNGVDGRVSLYVPPEPEVPPPGVEAGAEEAQKFEAAPNPPKSPDEFNTEPPPPLKSVKKLSLMDEFLKSVKKLPVAERGEDELPAGEEGKKRSTGKPEPFSATLAKEETKPPRDSILLTKLQQERPWLRDDANYPEDEDGRRSSGRTEQGDLLWEERFPEDIVVKAEEELGPDAPGQYQQRPTGESGDIFQKEYFRKYEPLWHNVELEDGSSRTVFGSVRLFGPTDGEVREFPANQISWFQTVDTALTESKRSAYTAILTFGVTSAFDLILWHVFRGRLNVQYQYPLIKLMRAGPVHWIQKAHKMIPAGKWPFRVITQAVEEKASGIGIIQEAASDGNPFHPLKADRDKVTRAAPVSTMYANGKVYHPASAPRWLADMEEELLVFPNGTFKDVADCIAHAGQMCIHDKIIRALCQNRVMAEGDEENELDSNKTVIDVGGNKHVVDWGDEDNTFGETQKTRHLGPYKSMFDSFFGDGEQPK